MPGKFNSTFVILNRINADATLMRIQEIQARPIWDMEAEMDLYHEIQTLHGYLDYQLELCGDSGGWWYKMCDTIYSVWRWFEERQELFELHWYRGVFYKLLATDHHHQCPRAIWEDMSNTQRVPEIEIVN